MNANELLHEIHETIIGNQPVVDMLKLLIIISLVIGLAACKADQAEPEDTGALPEPPMEEVPSPMDEEDTVEVPLHVPPVDGDNGQEERLEE